MELKPVQPTAKAADTTFTGDVYATPIHRGDDPSRLVVNLVHFTPGARTHWHSHAVGQTLHVVEGVGLVGNRDGDVLRMRTGDTVQTPAGEEHWHGATERHFMAHYSMLERDGGQDPTTWLEAVTDEQYRAANDK